jgi:uracil phosphoribosyltransferase
MLKVLTQTDSAANRFIYELRHKDIQIHRGLFRNNLKRLGIAMALKLSEDLEYTDVEVETPLGIKEMKLIREAPVLITILRAGNPFLAGFEEVFDDSDVGFIGAYRIHEGADLDVALNYEAFPEVEGRPVLLLDPMLATGQSMIQAYDAICKRGIPSKIFFVSVVAAPEGISYIQRNCKHNYEIWTGDLDEKLNELSYIVPGLGDAGDLSFGKKI